MHSRLHLVFVHSMIFLGLPLAGAEVTSAQETLRFESHVFSLEQRHEAHVS